IGGGAGWASCAISGSATAAVRIRQARARIAGRPPAISSDSTSSTVRPGRTTAALTRTSPVGSGPRISTASRVRWLGPGIEDSVRSTARVISADGGPACWVCGVHRPSVSGVAMKTSGSSVGRKKASLPSSPASAGMIAIVRDGAANRGGRMAERELGDAATDAVTGALVRDEPPGPVLDVATRIAQIADDLRALAGNGLHYGTNPYDIERYHRIQRLSAELLSTV